MESITIPRPKEWGSMENVACYYNPSETMRDAQIYPGDYVLVRQKEEPADGDIIAFEIGGQVFIRKLLWAMPEEWVLLAADNARTISRINPNESHFEYAGVVVGTLHKPKF